MAATPRSHRPPGVYSGFFPPLLLGPLVPCDAPERAPEVAVDDGAAV
jgi:hypothetical protein